MHAMEKDFAPVKEHRDRVHKQSDYFHATE
jgi:hypothetical protein